MTLSIGLGVANDTDLSAAIAKAAATARTECASPTLVLAFFTHNYGGDAVATIQHALAEAFPKGTRIAGGSVNGLLSDGKRYDALATDRAVAVLAIAGAKVGAALASRPTDPSAMGVSLVNTVREQLGGDLRGGWIFTPGLSAGIPIIDQQILDGIASVAPDARLSGSGFSGGIAADGKILEGWAFLGDRVETMGTLLVAFADARFGCGVANGMKHAGTVGTITEAHGPMLRSIDGKPARDVLLDALAGAEANTRELFQRGSMMASVEYNVGFATSDPSGNYFWADVPAALMPDGGALGFFARANGTKLERVTISRESCLGSIGEATQALVQDAGTKNFDLVLAFSCAVRGFTLGEEAAKEDSQLRSSVQAKKQLGIIANGEIGCRDKGQPQSGIWLFSLSGLAAGT